MPELKSQVLERVDRVAMETLRADLLVKDSMMMKMSKIKEVIQ